MGKKKKETANTKRHTRSSSKNNKSSQSVSKVDALQTHLRTESRSISVSVGGVGAIIDDHTEDSQETGHSKKKSVLQDFGLITDMTELAHISRQYSSPTAPTPQSTSSRPSFTSGDSQRVSDKK